MIVFEYPDSAGNNVTEKISEAEAVRRQRAACVKNRGTDLYADDAEGDRLAIEDFIIIHWAWQVVE